MYTSTIHAFKTAMANDGVFDFGDTNFVQASLANDGNPPEAEIRKIFKATRVYAPGTYDKELKGSTNCTESPCYSALDSDIPISDASVSTIVELADGTIMYLYKVEKLDTITSQHINNIKIMGGHLYKPYISLSFDVNGIKGPNKLGRDYFGQFLVNQDGMLYPELGRDDAIWMYAMINNSANYGWYFWHWQGAIVYHGYDSATRVIEEGWQMKY